MEKLTPTQQQDQATEKWARFKKLIGVPPMQESGREAPTPPQTHTFESQEEQAQFCETIFGLAHSMISALAEDNLSAMLDPSVGRWSRVRRDLQRERRVIETLQDDLTTPRTETAILIANIVLEKSYYQEGGVHHMYKPYRPLAPSVLPGDGDIATRFTERPPLPEPEPASHDPVQVP